MTDALGLGSGEVRVVDYDARWPALFATEAARLRGYYENLPLALEHIGSTAIPGLCAKPVLDLLAGHGDPPLSQYIACLERAGYEHRGDRGIRGHEFFRRGQPRAYHVHLVERGGTLWREYLAFRDRLRTDTDLARQYAALKRSLAAQFPRDRESYIDGKTAFVRAILLEAPGHG